MCLLIPFNIMRFEWKKNLWNLYILCMYVKKSFILNTLKIILFTEITKKYIIFILKFIQSLLIIYSYRKDEARIHSILTHSTVIPYTSVFHTLNIETFFSYAKVIAATTDPCRSNHAKLMF